MVERGGLETVLLAACDDTELLGFDLWPRQRDLLAAAECGSRLQVWALGRRSGKIDRAAMATAETPEQVVDVLRYVLEGQLPAGA